ncbi:hypothetical protein [Nocardiopsis sp. SBT366]|uniref:hypothetical protein n=1 Tax=Nocardiopsis sp. SBT366 TaxID=1580529 RepID=UPI00066C9E6C|nr:hypothetical protein [Nocardiopsis sp. SBT366]
MNTRIPASIAAGSLSLLLALTACGNEEPAAEGTADADEASSGSALEELLGNLGSSTQELTNYTLDMEVQTLDPTAEGDVTVTFNYQVTDDPAAILATVDMPFLGETMFELMSMAGGVPDGVTAEDLGASTVLLTEDGDTLIADPHGVYGAGTPWFRGEVDENADPTESFDVEALPDLAGAFSDLEDVTEVGTEEIDGVETTVVEGTMSTSDISELSAEERGAMENLFSGGLESAMDAKLWLDTDGFPMRIEFSDDESDVWMEFSAIGSTSFDMPSEDEIGTV